MPLRNEASTVSTSPKGMVLTPQMFLSIIDQCVVSGTNFLTMVILGRACGLGELGVYSLAFTIVVMLMAVQESLLIAPYTVIISRLRNSARRRSYAAATLLQQLMVAGAASMAIFTASVFAHIILSETTNSLILVTLAVVTPFWLLKEFARRICFVELDARRPLLLDIVSAIIQLTSLGILWWHQELSAIHALAAAGLGHAAAVAVWWAIFRPPLRHSRNIFRRACRLNWGLGSWTSIGRITEMMHAYSLYWLLAFVAGPVATGAYTAASSLLALANPVLMGIGNMLAPETARAYASGGLIALRQVVFRASIQVTIVTASFVLFLALGASPLLHLVFGDVREIQPAIVVILSIGMLIGMTSFGADNGLRALARPAANFQAALAGCVASLVVAALLVGSMGAIGASIGALIGNCAAAAVRLAAFWRISGLQSARRYRLASRATS